jgi:glycosyltransferase involved in cell wall biosynthesis
LPGVYALGDVFVFPTRGDPYGLVVDEALAAGLPVISTTSAGEIVERVKPGETGELVPRDDIDALAAAMCRMCDDPIGIARMGQAATRSLVDRTPASWAVQIERAQRALEDPGLPARPPLANRGDER